MKIALALGALLTTLLLLWLLMLFLRQDSMILRPDIAAAQHGSAEIPRAEAWHAEAEHRGFVIEPGSMVRGTVLIFHGNASLAKGMGALAEPFLRQGLRVVLPEYPGFGERAGQATVSAALASALEDFRLARTSWPQPVYLAGHSFGAGIAAQVAGAFPQDVAGVVLFTPWNSLAALVDEVYGGVPISILLRHRMDSAAALRDFPGPVVVIASENDRVVPARHAKALAKALPRAVYIEMAGEDHASWLHRPISEIYRQIFHAFGLPPAVRAFPGTTAYSR